MTLVSIFATERTKLECVLRFCNIIERISFCDFIIDLIENTTVLLEFKYFITMEK